MKTIPEYQVEWCRLARRHHEQQAEFIMGIISRVTGLVEQGTPEDTKLYEALLEWLEVSQ